MINIFNSNSIQKNKCESWREDISFPANLELGYCVVTARGNIILGYEAAKKAAEIWQPISSTGIGTINSNVLLPAICVPEFKDVVLRRYRSRVHIVIIILSLFVIGISGMGANIGKFNQIAPIVIFITALLSLIVVDEYVYLRNYQNLADRGRFMFWFQSQRYVRKSFGVVIMIAALLATLQLTVAGLFAGGQHELIERFGLVYSHVKSGEYWRVIVGPFIHASIPHLLANAVMASFVAPFLFYYLRLHALYIFLPGVIISSLAQWQISTHGDALLGLSGGICAMLGAALVLCIRKTLFFPKGLPLQVGGIAFLSIIGAQAFAPDSATVAHLAGYVFGIGVTIFIRLEKIQN